MALNKNLLKLTCIASTSLFIISCANNSYVTKANPTTGQANRSVYSNVIKKQKPNIALTEYITRVGKKIILVSNNPEANYLFTVNQNNYNAIEAQPNGVISINYNVLQSLNNEAELAYILAIGINKINNNFSFHSAEQEDEEIASLLELANYDPRVIVELQEAYLNNPDNQNIYWLKTTSKFPINNQRISYNKKMVNNTARGLQRNANLYNNIVKARF